ncbi:MAG: hypothetical protein ACYSWZ_19210 [Planctomycetota bacterium]|jgi:hypothetical protein
MKARYKGYWGVFLGQKVIVAVVLLAIIVPVVGRVFSAVLAQTGGGLILLSTTTTGADTVSPSAVNESVMNSAPHCCK